MELQGSGIEEYRIGMKKIMKTERTLEYNTLPEQYNFQPVCIQVYLNLIII